MPATSPPLIQAHADQLAGWGALLRTHEALGQVTLQQVHAPSLDDFGQTEKMGIFVQRLRQVHNEPGDRVLEISRALLVAYHRLHHMLEHLA